MLVYLGLAVIVVGILFIVGQKSTIGYEDEHGFHFGFPPVTHK